jgi:membrane-associated protein
VNFLSGLHGAVGLAVLCGLLFAEESGVPLPFAPGEVTLLFGGLLIASGGLNPYVFIPLAIVACIAGSLVGYSWARVVGEHGLQAVARRLRQQRNLERVSRRIRSAGWVGVAISRLIPGLRIYTTLVAGAARVPRQTFVLAMGTSTVVWVGVYVALGILVGVPVEHFLNDIQKVALQGAILIAIGVGCYIAVRKTPASSGAGLVRVPRGIRVLVAAAIDIGVVASVITGVLAVGRLLGFGFGAGWVDAVVALLVVGAFYVVVARRTAGATVGEALLQTSYVSRMRVPLRPRAALETVLALLSGPADDLTATATSLHVLGDPQRLRIVSQLLERPHTAEELARQTGWSEFEILHQLDRLDSAQIIEGVRGDSAAVYTIRSELRAPLIQLLAAMRPAHTSVVGANGADITAPDVPGAHGRGN